MKSAKSKFNNLVLILPSLILVFMFFSCQTGKSVERLGDDGFVYAMIYDNESNPVSGVSVFLDGKKITDSDIQGRFVLEKLKKGTYAIKLVKKGYENLEENFEYVPLHVLYFKLFNAVQLLNLAENALDVKDYAEADRFLDRALTLEPDRHDFLFLKSINLYLQGKYDEARIILEKLVNSGVNDHSVNQLLELVTHATQP
jgi:tetratricopeptide (TPR) repeat protein